MSFGLLSRVIEKAAEVLRAVGLVTLPTETIFGLGARPTDGMR
jgi:tRNA A37 threonylcarbamoyladenosine synthetase subunit TsaC/SUA5/YrdC